MTIVSETTSAQSPGLVENTGSGSVLGKDDFLKLLVAQLENQDPMNPDDPTEFTAQLAQFSSLEQLFTVNESLSAMISSQGDLAKMTALSMINREVVSKSHDFTLDDKPVLLGYSLDESVDELELLIKDGTGRTVAVLPATELEKGDHFLEWDGTGENGQVLPAGEYNFYAVVTSADNLEEVPTLVKGTVTGVNFDSARDVLVTTSGEFFLSDIQSVREQ
jgi:flagellar basal-body rod modification protein FlgD